MRNQQTPAILAPSCRDLWRLSEPSIWTPIGGEPAADPARSIMRTLWDQPRWLEAYHLYDDRGAALFEQICALPEYYLTRTENAILEHNSETIIGAAPVECIVELGAGSAKKTVHLLDAQKRARGGGIFAPIDVSTAGLRSSRDFVREHLREIEFHGLHARYEEGFSAIDKNMPTLFVFLGSTVGNFNPSAFVRFFTRLSRAMGPRDFFLLGADRVKDIDVLERAYNDSQGVTAEFILNVFENVNRLTGSNFERRKMRYHSLYNSHWGRIEMYAIATAAQEIRFRSFAKSFSWDDEERILVEISRKFDPVRLGEQLTFFDLAPVAHFTDPKDWFSLLLFKKSV